MQFELQFKMCWCSLLFYFVISQRQLKPLLRKFQFRNVTFLRFVIHVLELDSCIFNQIDVSDSVWKMYKQPHFFKRKVKRKLPIFQTEAFKTEFIFASALYEYSVNFLR